MRCRRHCESFVPKLRYGSADELVEVGSGGRWCGESGGVGIRRTTDALASRGVVRTALWAAEEPWVESIDGGAGAAEVRSGHR